MKDIYIPKETIAKSIAIIVCGVASLLKMFGVELTSDITETDVYTSILAIIDGVVFLYFGVYKNFITSVSNDSHTKQMREDKQMASVPPETVEEPKGVE